ncbi:Uncharacterized protein DBV15_10528 [Temnothorax longispinosus]|uniref:Uncharacterized protein n=1 Tax=Temnothorax longispinosus TaxID=300112 RepID=A0A4S2JZV4_9HYME|nr:Uncharacterized protein DBV15_10528 [Temnothorax longispinosus]
MRDVISGEYLPLTIGQFCNILPDDGDEIVAPLRAINRIYIIELSHSSRRAKKARIRRHRNGPVIALHAREIDARNSRRRWIMDGPGRIDRSPRLGPVGDQARPPRNVLRRPTGVGIGFRGRDEGHGRSS